MKKVRITGIRKAEIVDVATPGIKGDWALVKILVAPMCTEYKSFSSGKESVPLGHEAVGEVIKLAQPGKVHVGDRVVVMPTYPCGKCNLCESGEYIHCENIIDFYKYTGSMEGLDTYAQYIIKPSWLLPVIPDHISYEHASMLCCGLGPTFGAMETMGVNCNNSVLITGMGPVGLGGVVNGVFRGAKVICVSRNEYRSKLALDLGASDIVNPDDPNIIRIIKDLTNGIGVDISVDCSGDETAQQFCINTTKRKGQIAFVGESGGMQLEVSNQLIRNGLTLHGVWHYNLNDVPKLFQIVEACRDSLDKMITHKFPLAEVMEAWDLQTTRQCGKVLLYPWN